MIGVPRRVLPNIFGCSSSLVGSGFGCGIGHPPLLEPGESTTFRYLLKEYDLRPGQHRLVASGKAGVRWKYYPTLAPDRPPPPPPRHRESDPVAGAEFSRSLPLIIEQATERELRAAFAPLVADADGSDLVRRAFARTAIVESAPSFLEPVIARFAAETEYDTSGIDALGRLASPRSRAALRDLLSKSGEPSRRSAIVLALARAGHRDDAGFFASVLEDSRMDARTRQYAALGLGRIGGV